MAAPTSKPLEAPGGPCQTVWRHGHLRDHGSRSLDQRRYATLDGLRGVAALSVVALHEFSLLGRWTPQGGFLAVDLFFVLSGFVIAGTYEPRLDAGKMTALGFLRVRAIRLYPLYALGLLIGVGVAAAAFISHHYQVAPVEKPAWLSLLPGLVMLPGPPLSADSALYPLNSVFWSLLFELIVNFIFVLTRKFWSIPGLLGMMAISGACILLDGGRDFDGWTWGGFGMDMARVMYSFPAGVLIWRLKDRLRWLPSLPPVLLFGASLLAFVSADPVLIQISVIAVLPLLVLLGTRTEPRGLMRGASLKIGAASYALYALHYPILNLLEDAAQKLRLQLPGVVFSLLFAAVMIGGAVVADRYYDAPVRRLLSRLTAARAPNPTGAIPNPDTPEPAPESPAP